MDNAAKPPENSVITPQSPADADTGESLESSVTSSAANDGMAGSLESSEGGVVAAPGEQPRQKQPEKSKKFSLRALWRRVNVYLLIFVFLLIVGAVVVVVAFMKSSNQNPTNNSPPSQNLSASALQQLANNGTTIGGAKETLNIESNAVFQGTVLVRGNLDVAGTVKMGGTLALQSLTVSGSSSFGQLQAKGLSVSGNTGIQGQLTALSLSVAGDGSFNGAVTAPAVITNSLQLGGDLGITHHIDTGGGVPGIARGGALGSGGSASVSGSDTAGSISIHTGGGTGGGCFATVSFTRSFATTPHVVITPVGLAAASVRYYINRSTSGFSVCTANAAPAGTSFGFDYIVLD
ncbi:MAG TPA: hypothetical protein VGG13_02125 [Candidatus Saccharimonadales bacterium]|jgi:cytoskeletal protein CcmA (bactofilin family)